VATVLCNKFKMRHKTLCETMFVLRFYTRHDYILSHWCDKNNFVFIVYATFMLYLLLLNWWTVYLRMFSTFVCGSCRTRKRELANWKTYKEQIQISNCFQNNCVWFDVFLLLIFIYLMSNIVLLLSMLIKCITY